VSKFAIAGVLGLAAGLAAAAPAHAGQAVVTFNQPGDVTVLAPAGVTGVDVRLAGGAGGGGGALLGAPGAGGAGALLGGHLATAPGSSLTVRIGGGGAGGAAPRAAGGKGGDMAAILAGTTYEVVAGGGGGGGGGRSGGDGGSADAAGLDGFSGQGNASGGGAGSAGAGGAGGAAFASPGAGQPGVNGGAGAGGAGGATTLTTTGAGGGGGGGIFGGGGGGGTSAAAYGAGGGGGGASFVDAQALPGATQALSPDAGASVRFTWDDESAPKLTLASMTFNPTTLSGVAGTELGDDGHVALTLSSGQTSTAPVGADGAYSVALPSLADGDYTVTATQSDAGGNHTTITGSFIVDTVGPTIDTSAIKDHYTLGSNAKAVFSCSDPNGVAACDGPATLDTSSLGDHALTITARDDAGNTSSVTVHYTVVPIVLAITLGSASPLGPFQLGVARDYTATATAQVTTNVDAAAFSVTDPSATAPGHLVNGAFVLPSALQVGATSMAATSLGTGALSGSPLALLQYTGPVDTDLVTLTFTQHIGATDVMRTGGYGKTLTFTLSTTTP
jgi:hypothetical protein